MKAGDTLRSGAVACTFHCNICEIPKGETNHWIMARTGAKNDIRFTPWNKSGALRVGTNHLCGEGCASKRLSQHLKNVQEKFQIMENIAAGTESK